MILLRFCTAGILRSFAVKLILLTGLGLILLPKIDVAQGFLHTQDGRIVNEAGSNVLLRGIGLGGWMLQEGYMLRVQGIGQQQHVIREHMEDLVGKARTDSFYEAWLANHTTRKDIEALKQWGFNSVRLPIHYNLFTLPVEKEPVKGEQTWIQQGFDLTDSLLAWCRDNEMYLILDLHAAPGGQGHDLNIADGDDGKPFLWDNPENQRKTIALWKKLAERYKDEPWVAAYDLLNETNWGFTDKNDKNGLNEKSNAPLKSLMMDITRAIREIDKKHIIIIEGNGWGNNYNGILPPWDNNMVLSFHKYWNYNDQASVQQFINYRNQYNIPIWLGESGENSNVWFTQAISLMEKNNIGWCWWPLKKIGINNPLEIPMNEEYVKILAYWDKKGPKPDAQIAYTGLMKLARNSNFDQNIIHHDVVDAMVNQVSSPASRAFARHNVVPGFVLPAAEYDYGVNGAAYFDTDTADYHIATGTSMAGNRGRVFRNDGVDLRHDGDDYIVTDIEDGEWLQYTIDVQEPMTYLLGFSVSSDTADKGALVVSMPGSNFLNEIQVPVTGSDQTWKQVVGETVSLSKGKHVLKIGFKNGGFNLKDIRFLKAF